ncbi:hypothetical protein HMPREF3213_02500 [Heyndrickxia coagulans]|uniref:Uncharacterized protein n=1 Tax=Heyndrickxia coagulans TaxID=1398 RepID=A0A133KJQ9_HEYCO|nr:hypothetical protein HMPREF3213_02500 [Heyndrickxia coagulans]
MIFAKPAYFPAKKAKIQTKFHPLFLPSGKRLMLLDARFPHK